MFVRSALLLTGALILGSSAVGVSTSFAQKATVKIGNPSGTDIKVKSIQVDAKNWRCTPPVTSLFRTTDSLEFDFTSDAPVDEVVTLRIESTGSSLEVQTKLSAKQATADVASATGSLYVSPVWPNPAKDYLAFNVHGLAGREATAFVYDMLGKEIYQHAVNQDGTLRLELPPVSEGRYYFMLRDGMETLSIQEIKISK